MKNMYTAITTSQIDQLLMYILIADDQQIFFYQFDCIYEFYIKIAMFSTLKPIYL